MVGQNGKWHAIIASGKWEVYMHHGQVRSEAGSPSAVAYHYLPLAVMSHHLPFPIMAILSEINCMWSSVCKRMRSGVMVSLWSCYVVFCLWQQCTFNLNSLPVLIFTTIQPSLLYCTVLCLQCYTVKYFYDYTHSFVTLCDQVCFGGSSSGSRRLFCFH